MNRAAHRRLNRVAARWADFAGAEGGAAAVYVAIALPVFVGAGGLAVDVASWYSTKRTVQSGADAAAYAAALELARQGLDQAPDTTMMQAVADDAASRNGVATPVTVRVPLSGPAAGDPQSVEVIVTQPAPVYFTSLFMGAPPPITARAVAKAVVSDACIWSLHPSAEGAFRASGAADVDLDCGVVINSDHDQAALLQEGSSCVSATSVSVHGGYTGSCVSPEPEVFTPNYGDPLSYLTPPTYGATCNYPNPFIVDSAMAAAYGGGPVPLGPGVYCDGIEIQANQEAIFAPGLYVLKTGQFRIAGNAEVSNTENASGGVTFYLTGTGTDYATLEFESGAIITLTPTTTGPLANVLFYQDPNAPASTACSKSKTSPKCSRFAGGVTMDLTGILYFPNQHVEMTGGSSTDEIEILLVASTVAFTGNSYLNADYAQSLLPEQHYARFVE